MDEKKKSGKISGPESKAETYAETTPDPRDELYEEITRQSQPFYTISVEEAPMRIDHFLPERRYRFKGADAVAGDEFIGDIARFLEANEYLALDDEPTREYARGFAQAIAVVALFMDSAQLTSA